MLKFKNYISPYISHVSQSGPSVPIRQVKFWDPPKQFVAILTHWVITSVKLWSLQYPVEIYVIFFPGHNDISGLIHF